MTARPERPSTGATGACAEQGSLRPIVRAPSGERAFGDGPTMSDHQYRQLRAIVHEHSGLAFRDDQRYLLERRLAPRLRAHGLADFTAYCRLLRQGQARYEELQSALDAITTNETYLFREPVQLRAFSQELLPALAREKRRARTLRVWSAGCSTGEEAYTIAILLVRSGLFGGWKLEVFGSDIARRVLSVARAGAYGPGAFRSPEAEEMRPWFRPEAGKWIVRDEIRALTRFASLNLLDASAAAVAGEFDAIFCRNVLIYFDLPVRKRVVETFRERLRPGGYLLLGHSETLLNVTAEFEFVHLRDDLVYRKPCDRT